MCSSWFLCWCVSAAHPQRVGVRRRFSADARRPRGSSHGAHEQLLQQTRARRDPGGIQQERGTLAATHTAGRFSLHGITAVSVNTSHRSWASSVVCSQPFLLVMLVSGSLEVHVGVAEGGAVHRAVVKSQNGSFSDGQEHSLILQRNKRSVTHSNITQP